MIRIADKPTPAQVTRLASVALMVALALAVAVWAQDPPGQPDDPPPTSNGPAVVFPGQEPASGDSGAPAVPELLRPQTQPDLPTAQRPESDLWLRENLDAMRGHGYRVETVLTGWEWQPEPWRGRQLLAVALAPEGARTATLDAAGLTLRAAANGRAMRHYPEAAGATQLVFSTDGRAIAVAGFNDNATRIRVFSTIDGGLLGERTASTPVTALALGEHGVRLTDGRTVWRLGATPHAMTLGTPAGGTPRVVALLDSDPDDDGQPRRTQIAVAGDDFTTLHVLVWNDSTGAPPRVASSRDVALPGVRATAMAFEPGGWLALGSDDGTFRLVRAMPEGGVRLRDIWHMGSPISAIAPALSRRIGLRFVVGSADGAMTHIVAGEEDAPGRRGPLSTTTAAPGWSPLVGVAFAQQVAPGPGGALRLVDYLVGLSDDGGVRIHQMTSDGVRFDRAQPAGAGAVRVLAVSPVVGRDDATATASPVRRLAVVRDRVARIWRLPVDRAPWLENTLSDLTFRPEVARFSDDGRQIVFAAGDAIDLRDAATATRLMVRAGDRHARRALLVAHQRVVTVPADPGTGTGAARGDIFVRDADNGELLEAIAPFVANGPDPNDVPAAQELLPAAPDSVVLLEHGRWLLLERHTGNDNGNGIALFRLADRDAAAAGQPDATGGWPVLRHGYLRLGPTEGPIGDPQPVHLVACGDARYIVVRRRVIDNGGAVRLILERYRPASHESPLTIGQPDDLPAELADIAVHESGSLVVAATADGAISVWRTAAPTRMAARIQLPTADAGPGTRVQIVDATHVLIATARGALLLVRID